MHHDPAGSPECRPPSPRNLMVTDQRCVSPSAPPSCLGLSGALSSFLPGAFGALPNLSEAPR
eukprot:3248607-Alexandrium_andersonii.AAC.1